MTTHSLVLSHTDGLEFKTQINGMDLILDGSATNPGIGPKKLLLAALAGCTAMDVVSILEKMKVEFSDFSIFVEAPLSEEHPKIYSAYTLVYYIKVDKQNEEKVLKAVNLSKEKYCGVSAMLSASAPIKFTIEYLP